MYVESNPSLFRLCFTSLCDFSRKLALFSQPIRCKTKTNRTFVTRVFARFTQVIRFYSAFSLAPCDIFPSFFYLFYDTQSKSALSIGCVHSSTFPTVHLDSLTIFRWSTDSKTPRCNNN